MKSIFCLICLVVFTSLEAQAQTEFELTNSQSMLMTGKGPGQDATINPYDGEDCMAMLSHLDAPDESEYSLEEIPQSQMKEDFESGKLYAEELLESILN